MKKKFGMIIMARNKNWLSNWFTFQVWSQNLKVCWNIAVGQNMWNSYFTLTEYEFIKVHVSNNFIKDKRLCHLGTSSSKTEHAIVNPNSSIQPREPLSYYSVLKLARINVTIPSEGAWIHISWAPWNRTKLKLATGSCK